MSLLHRSHCSCPAHRAVAPLQQAALPSQSAGRGIPWPAVLAVLACAICPACLTTYAKLLSVLGVGFGLSETAHLLLLAGAVSASLLLSAWRTWRNKRVWPLAVATLGVSLLLLAHWAEELHVLEWLGVLVLLAGGLFEHFRLRGAGARDDSRLGAITLSESRGR